MTLRELLQKGSDASLLREMIGFAAQRLMELETEPLCGAAHGERSTDRLNQRNGDRERGLGNQGWLERRPADRAELRDGQAAHPASGEARKVSP